VRRGNGDEGAALVSPVLQTDESALPRASHHHFLCSLLGSTPVELGLLTNLVVPDLTGNRLAG
jgi:hypothetical protein